MLVRYIPTCVCLRNVLSQLSCMKYMGPCVISLPILFWWLHAYLYFTLLSSSNPKYDSLAHYFELSHNGMCSMFYNVLIMMPKHWNAVHITGPLWGEASCHQNFYVFFIINLNKLLNKQSSCSDLRCHDTHMTSLSYGWVTKVWLSCYLVLLSFHSKTR